MSDNENNSRLDRVPEGYMWIRRRQGDEELEIIGKADDIKSVYKEMTSSNGHKPKETVKIDQPTLPLFGEESTPLLLQGNDVPSSEIPDGNSQPDEPKQPSNEDFIQFWEEKLPQNQSEQIVAITYYYTVGFNHPQLSFDDYDKAYDILADIPVEKPKGERGVSNAVNNLFKSGKYKTFLRRTENGQFSITRVGKQFVESMKRVIES
jgi:hypothetical protein